MFAFSVAVFGACQRLLYLAHFRKQRLALLHARTWLPPLQKSEARSPDLLCLLQSRPLEVIDIGSQEVL